MSSTSPNPTWQDHANVVVDIDTAGAINKEFVFAHEIGHLLAALHNWNNDSANNSPYTYNHGFVRSIGGSGFRTVMSYLDSSVLGCGVTTTCPRVPYFSSTDSSVTYAGWSVGQTGAQTTDNSQTLNNSNFIVRDYRAGWPIGTYYPGLSFYFDTNANAHWDGCAIDRCTATYGQTGDLPVVNGFGVLGVFRPSTGMWYP